jgi:flavin-dependent dehydrogenase
MKEKYNVIIAGGGPAGLMAAIRSGQQGLRTLLVEKKSNPCEALRTTGNAFRIKNPVHGEYLTLDKKKGKAVVHFHNSNFDLDYTGPLIDMYDSYSFSNSGHCLHTTRKDRPMSCVYSMSAFLGDLKDAAERAGVEFLTGTIALGAENKADYTRLKIKKGTVVSWLDTDYIIAADGLNSRLAGALGCNTDRPVVIRGPCFETVFEGVAVPYPPGFSFVLGKDMLGGNGFLFVYPHAEGENSYCVMVNNRFPADQGQKIINHFTQKSRFSTWFKNARPVNYTATIVTVRPPMVTPYVERVLFIGDSAAYGETLVPGALRCGYYAADAVHKELSGGNGFEEYQRFWSTNFEYVTNPQKQKGYTKILGLFHSLEDEEIDFLFRLAEEKGPIEETGDVVASNEFTKANALINFFLEFPQVQGDLRKKLETVRG